MKENCTILHKQYDELVTYHFHTTEEKILTSIQECTSGQYQAKFIEEQIVEVNI